MFEFVYASGYLVCVTCFGICLGLFEKRFRNQFIKIISILGSSDGWLGTSTVVFALTCGLKSFASSFIHCFARGQFSISSKKDVSIYFIGVFYYVLFPFYHSRWAVLNVELRKTLFHESYCENK